MEFAQPAAERVHVRALAVEMNREQRPEFVVRAAAQKGLDLVGSRFKVCASISANTGRAPTRTMALAEAKKLKGVVRTSISGLHSGGSQSQPQSVGTRGATHSIARAAEVGKLALEGLDLGAQNVVL